MTNSRASSNMVLLESHVATGTEATYTLTRTLPYSQYASIIVKVTISASAQLALQLKINGATSYYIDGHMNDTAVDLSAQTTVELMTNTFIDVEDAQASGTIEIIPANSSFTNERIMGNSDFYGSGTGHRKLGFMPSTSLSDITSIEIKTSTSTWKAGSRISIYGILR